MQRAQLVADVINVHHDLTVAGLLRKYERYMWSDVCEASEQDETFDIVKQRRLHRWQ